MAENAEKTENQRPRKLPLPFLAGAVVLLIAATFFFGRTVGAGSPKKPRKPAPGYRLKLEEMVVNLRGRDRFIKVAPEVEFAKPAKTSTSDNFSPFISRIEGVLTVVLRVTPLDALETEEGIRRVERQMNELINRAIVEPDGSVRNDTQRKIAHP